jgi:hypothetical protein
MFPSFPRYKEGTGGRGQIEPGPPVVIYDLIAGMSKMDKSQSSFHTNLQATSFPGLQYEDEGRDEEAMIYTKTG